MSLFKNNSDLLDDAVHQVADDPIDPRQVEEAAARVWARLSQEGASAVQAADAPVAAAPATGSLHGCEDFQSLIPAYVRGELSPARCSSRTIRGAASPAAGRSARPAKERWSAARSRPRPGRIVSRQIGRSG
jgi:hypothetical protein